MPTILVAEGPARQAPAVATRQANLTERRDMACSDFQRLGTRIPT